MSLNGFKLRKLFKCKADEDLYNISNVLMVYLKVLTDLQSNVTDNSDDEVSFWVKDELTVVVVMQSTKTQVKYTVSYTLQVSLCGSV